MRIWNGTEQLLYDANRERELMDILGIQSMGEVTIIPPTRRPGVPGMCCSNFTIPSWRRRPSTFSPMKTASIPTRMETAPGLTFPRTVSWAGPTPSAILK